MWPNSEIIEVCSLLSHATDGALLWFVVVTVKTKRQCDQKSSKVQQRTIRWPKLYDQQLVEVSTRTVYVHVYVTCVCVDIMTTQYVKMNVCGLSCIALTTKTTLSSAVTVIDACNNSCSIVTVLMYSNRGNCRRFELIWKCIFNNSLETFPKWIYYANIVPFSEHQRHAHHILTACKTAQSENEKL